MEHLIANSTQIQHREIRIFSDSRTVVAIITLNWVSDQYRVVIKKSMTICLYWNPQIVWTPCHSEVQGNDVADRLGKETAIEAKELGEETGVVTVLDIKIQARVSI